VVLRETRSWLASWRQEGSGVGGEDPAENGIHQRLSHLFLQTAARLKINV
jgi:hypothetical protein